MPPGKNSPPQPPKAVFEYISAVSGASAAANNSSSPSRAPTDGAAATSAPSSSHDVAPGRVYDRYGPPIPPSGDDFNGEDVDGGNRVVGGGENRYDFDGLDRLGSGSERSRDRSFDNSVQGDIPRAVESEDNDDLLLSMNGGAHASDGGSRSAASDDNDDNDDDDEVDDDMMVSAADAADDSSLHMVEDGHGGMGDVGGKGGGGASSMAKFNESFFGGSSFLGASRNLVDVSLEAAARRDSMVQNGRQHLGAVEEERGGWFNSKNRKVGRGGRGGGGRDRRSSSRSYVVPTLRQALCRREVVVAVLGTICIALGVALIRTREYDSEWEEETGMGGKGGAGAESSSIIEDKADRYRSIKDLLETVTPPEVLADESSPQGRAMTWIASKDARRVDPSSDPDGLVQRYAAATLFFATGGGAAESTEAEANPDSPESTTSSSTPWVRNFGFLAFDHECEWNAKVESGAEEAGYAAMGVFCDNESDDPLKIREIVLPMNDLTGTIPEELGLLSSVNNVALFSNDGLGGSIPQSIKNLAGLRKLEINDCQLTGSLPSVLGELSDLTDVILSNNQIRGPVLEELFTLEKLENLQLHGNILTSTIPSRIGESEALQHLSLDNNHLTGTIPELDGNLKKLRTLNLANNNLEGTMPYVQDMEMLESLSLSNNALTGPIFYLRPLTELKELRLDNNLLTGLLPEGIFFVGTKLEYLTVGHNKLRGELPSTLNNAAYLKNLQVNDNEFIGTLPLEGMALLGALQVARFQGNKLQGSISLPSGDGSFLGNLQVLDLSRNDLMSSIPPDIGSLTSLTELYLDYNGGLTGTLPREIFDLENLVALHLNNNQLKGTIGTDITKLTSLSDMRLDDNDFSGMLPAQIDAMQDLTHVAFDENKFGGTIATTIGLLKNLQHFTVQGNQMTGTVPTELNRLQNLETLGLERNSFTGAFPIEGLVSLQVLKARENKFTGSISKGLFTVNLTEVDLSRNEFSGTLPESVGKSVSLESLDLSANRISGTLPPEIGRSTALRKLLVSGNSFTGELPDVLGELTKMESLEVAKNMFSGSVPRSLVRLASLSTLELSENDFEGSLDFMCINELPFKLFTSDCYGEKPEVNCGCCTLCCSDVADQDKIVCHQN